MVFKNNLYAFGIKVPQRQRYLLTISIALLVVGIWYVFVYQSFTHAVYQTDLAVKQLHDKQTILASTEKLIGEQRKLIEEKQKEFIAFREQQVTEKTSLFSLAHQNGLHLAFYAPELSTDRGWYTTTKITCNLSGTFDQILSFVDSCSRQQQSLGITTFSITRRDDDLHCDCVLEMMKIQGENDEKK